LKGLDYVDSRIKWVTDGARVKLPHTVAVLVDDDCDMDDVAGLLSDHYGFLISSLEVTC
jgi:hypothetical protein